MSDFDEENLCTPSVSDQQSFSTAYYHHGFTMIVLPSLTSSYNSSCDKKGPLTLPRQLHLQQLWKAQTNHAILRTGRQIRNRFHMSFCRALTNDAFCCFIWRTTTRRVSVCLWQLLRMTRHDTVISCVLFVFMFSHLMNTLIDTALRSIFSISFLQKQQAECFPSVQFFLLSLCPTLSSSSSSSSHSLHPPFFVFPGISLPPISFGLFPLQNVCRLIAPRYIYVSFLDTALLGSLILTTPTQIKGDCLCLCLYVALSPPSLLN